MIPISLDFDRTHGNAGRDFVALGMPRTVDHNRELAAIFHQMAACYRYLGAEHRFRAQAYEKASRTLSALKTDVSGYVRDEASLNALNGIGESIAAKIIEYLRTGKIKTFEQLKKQVPMPLLELMDISGFGPATVRTLHERFHIHDREELIRRLESGALALRNGLGPGRLEQLARSLKLHSARRQRMPLAEALLLGQQVLDEVKKIPGVERAELAGSLRRRKETVGDIDLVISAERRDWTKIGQGLMKLSMLGRVIVHGKTRTSFLCRGSLVQVDIRVVTPKEFGAAWLYFTGSREHTLELRALARAKGWKLNEYGLFDQGRGKRLTGETEAGIYEQLGMAYIEPAHRE